MRTFPEFIALIARSPWAYVGGVSLSRIWPDLLHILDLALSPEAAASALTATAEQSPWPGQTQQLRLSAAYADFVNMCRADKVRSRAPPFQLDAIKGNKKKLKFPTFAQKHLSGAESVVLVRWLALVCAREAEKDGSEHNKLRAALFLGLGTMRKILTSAGFYLNAEELKELEYYNSMYHSALNALATEATHHGQLLWKVRPKGHQLDHLCLDAAVLMNPIQTSAYSEEDLVGRMKRLALQCHPRRLGLTVLQRYCWYCCVRWLKTDE
ncbi:unnamed protein product [Symbiodinium sp. CCMP2592]|nr:unnamed protein product [Symbiodinium sp. CCMP2592]